MKLMISQPMAGKNMTRSRKKERPLSTLWRLWGTR
nr:MAG TPA: hypothetical protein [Caudoviricetes sp.]